MLSDALQVVAIFLLTPLIIAFFAWQSYKRLMRREHDTAAKEKWRKEDASRQAAHNKNEAGHGSSADR